MRIVCRHSTIACMDHQLMDIYAHCVGTMPLHICTTINLWSHMLIVCAQHRTTNACAHNQMHGHICSLCVHNIITCMGTYAHVLRDHMHEVHLSTLCWARHNYIQGAHICISCGDNTITCTYTTHSIVTHMYVHIDIV